MEDIAPELLEKIKKDFEKKLEKSETIKAFREKVKKKTATYKDANDFAIEAGELLTDAFQSNLSKEILPDGKMYYNIADRIIRERLEHNYDITAEAAVEVQKILNEKAGIGNNAISRMKQSGLRGVDFVAVNTDRQILNRNLAQMLKGGVIMDVTNAQEAEIAEAAGAVAVMALERVPSDIRRDGGVARMSDPKLIKEIKSAVSIPVMAKVRIGHIVEAEILEALGIDYIDESEVLTPADDLYHLDKHAFKIPFVCGARNLGEALRRIGEGAAMIRTKGEAGTGNVVEAVRHMRTMMGQIRLLQNLPREEWMSFAKEQGAPYELVAEVAAGGRLPVVNFAAGGIATPADAALMMKLGSEGVFVGSGIFRSGNPAKRAKAIVLATSYYNDPKIVAEVSEDLGEAMSGIDIKTIPAEQTFAERGW